MKELILKTLKEALVLKADKANGQIVIQSDETDVRKASQETFKNKTALSAAQFKWKGDIKAWTIPIDKFEHARTTIEAINKKESFVSKIEDLEDFLQQSEDIGGKGNLMDKITMYVQDLSNITDEAAMSAEIRRYLTFFAKFKGHSWNNTILIFIQNPKASQVAGFKQWETKHNRRVKKGAKGIMIFAPIFRKGDADVQDDKGLDKEVKKGNPVSFRPVYVFDIADTEAINADGEIPTQPDWFTTLEPTERTEELFNYLSEFAQDMGTNITYDTSKGGEKGFSAGDHINMSSTVKGAGEFSTLVHEMAHELMHWKKSSIYYQEEQTSRSLKELQAESVAYVVMKHYELPCTHSSTYIALWNGNKEKIMSNIKVISEVGRFIINGIETVAHASKVVQK